jgi:uncharacterized protein YceH (UPF0502 family)
VLAVLAEKEALTPDAYPMSMNALTNGCNQLSSRDPVMNLTEDDVQQVVQRLIQDKFVAEVSQAGARVPKYQHRLRIKWSLEQDKLAVLTILMLRGPQIAGEIRTRSGRLHEFATVADVEICLQFLIDKYPPLVARQLLGGEAALAREETAAGLGGSVSAGGQGSRVAALEQEVQQLRQQVEDLTAQFAEFRKQFE